MSPMYTCLMSVYSMFDKKLSKMQVVGLAWSKMVPLGWKQSSVTKVSR